MKNKIVSLILTNLICSFIYSQNSILDSCIQVLSDDLAKKLISHRNEKMAVWELTDVNGEALKLENGETNMGKYVAEVVSINLSDKFHIVNRNQLKTITKENNLKEEGFISQKTTKKLKRHSDIDIIITGTITIIEKNVIITLQALDEDANILAGAKEIIKMNNEIIRFVNSPKSSDDDSKKNNSPIKIEPSNTKVKVESNNPPPIKLEYEPSNPPVKSLCQQQHIGEYCFKNNTSFYLYIIIHGTAQSYSPFSFSISVSPGETECLYSIPYGPTFYNISESTSGGQYMSGGYISKFNKEGQINVEQCISKTFNIK